MAALVNEALDESGAAQLRLVFQPIVSLMGDDQENHSVLLRLLDADADLHEAKAFIGAATASGRMGDIDRWVITHAIAELAKQRAKGHRLNFFINIGEASLQDDDLLIWICDTLRDQDARGSWLTFQFPEEEAQPQPARPDATGRGAQEDQVPRRPNPLRATRRPPRA